MLSTRTLAQSLIKLTWAKHKFWNPVTFPSHLNLARTREEDGKLFMNALWKKLTPLHTQLYRFKKSKRYETVANTIMNLAEQPKLQRNADDIEELLNAHTNKLTNEALIKLEAAKFKEHGKDRPAEVLQCFYIWEMMSSLKWLGVWGMVGFSPITLDDANQWSRLEIPEIQNDSRGHHYFEMFLRTRNLRRPRGHDPGLHSEFISWARAMANGHCRGVPM